MSMTTSNSKLSLLIIFVKRISTSFKFLNAVFENNGIYGIASLKIFPVIYFGTIVLPFPCILPIQKEDIQLHFVTVLLNI